MKKYTQGELEDMAIKMANKIIIMQIPQTLIDNLIQYAADDSHTDAIASVEDLMGKERCPHCGSDEWGSGLLKTFDKKYYEDGDDPEDYIYVCTNCEERFEEPVYAEGLLYYFIRPQYAQVLEDNWETVIYPDGTDPIWIREFTNCGIELDETLQKIAIQEEESK